MSPTTHLIFIHIRDALLHPDVCLPAVPDIYARGAGLVHTDSLQVVPEVVNFVRVGHDALDGTGAERTEFLQSLGDFAGGGIEQQSVVPAAQTRTERVVFHPPPEQSVNLTVFIKFSDQVPDELYLAGFRIRPRRGVVDRRALPGTSHL